MTESEAPDDGMPAEVLMHAADLALSEGKSVILEVYGIVVVPDITALTAIAHGRELPELSVTTRGRPRGHGQQLPGLEAVDQIFEDD
jgi:hypothetical protein